MHTDLRVIEENRLVQLRLLVEQMIPLRKQATQPLLKLLSPLHKHGGGRPRNECKPFFEKGKTKKKKEKRNPTAWSQGEPSVGGCSFWTRSTLACSTFSIIWRSSSCCCSIVSMSSSMEGKKERRRQRNSHLSFFPRIFSFCSGVEYLTALQETAEGANEGQI